MKAFIFVLVALGLLASAQFDCMPIIHHKDVKKAYQYNFKSVWHKDGQPDTMTLEDGYSEYFMNLCGHTTFDCDNAEASVCLRTPLFTTSVIGVLQTQTWLPANDSTILPGQGLMVVYGGGESCGTAGSANRALIYLICDESTTGHFEGGAQRSSDCGYTFRYRTPAACGKEVPYNTGNGLDGAGIFLIILFVALVLYIVIGIILNMAVFHKEGPFIQMFPHYSFWVSLPGLVVDGCKFIAHGFKKGDYISV